jgi:hypothetical protein
MFVSRRALIGSAAAIGALTVTMGSTPARAMGSVSSRTALTPEAVPPSLLKRGLAALHAHAGRIARRDRIAIVDFTAPSSRRRMHVVDVESGRTTSFLVAHGRGSDPAHTGWLHSFSNQPGSNASSRGAYLTSDHYVGAHGRSQRLVGLDPTNDNAFPRAIVIHSAWYANADMIKTRGVLGRSEGCFAVGEAQLSDLFECLGEGRLIYADKV